MVAPYLHQYRCYSSRFYYNIPFGLIDSRQPPILKINPNHYRLIALWQNQYYRPAENNFIPQFTLGGSGDEKGQAKPLEVSQAPPKADDDPFDSRGG
jgi:hypothetical protein